MMTLRALITMLLLLASFCRAEVYVVTHRDNPVNVIAVQQLKDLYLARSRAFSNGEVARVYDAGDEVLRTRFLQRVVGMSARQFDAYWARLVFAGRVLPLGRVDDEQQLAERMRDEIYAVGYLAGPPSQPDLKTLLVIRD